MHQMDHNGEVTEGMAIDDLPLTHDPLEGFDRLVLREVTPGYVGEATECASVVADALGAARRLADISTQLSDHELTVATRSALLVMQQAEALVVALTTDAVDRGTITSSTAADATQWIGRLSRNEPLAEILGQQGALTAGPLIPIEPTADNPVEPVLDDGPLIAGLEPGHCSRLAKLATACRAPKNAVLLDAVITGRANTTIAKVALDAVGPIAAVLPTADRDDILSLLLDLGPGAGAKSVRELTRRIIATFGDDDAPDVEEDTLQAHESVSWSTLPTGLIRFIADLSPDHAETLKHAIQSMAAPAPGSDCCNNHHHRHRDSENKKNESTSAKHGRSDNETDGTGSNASDDAGEYAAADAEGETWSDHEAADTADDWTSAAGGVFGSRPDARAGDPDLRAPSKRRADALVELMRIAAQAVDSGGDIKSNGTARIVVTMDYERLLGALNGLGVSEAGTGMTPETIRQLACDAEIIPMVLGSESRPLDVGRKKRLVDKELRQAVYQRDRHCTFEGCTRPPVMCEVHHVKYWWHGGETSLLNSALLCSTHHRIVHRDNLTATVTHTGVTWHPAGTKRANTAAA